LSIAASKLLQATYSIKRKGKMIMYGEAYRTEKEAIVAYLKVLFQRLAE